MAKSVSERLETEHVAWLTTVSSTGTPQTSPIWFLWNGEDILIYSLESARTRNIRSNPRVSFNFDGNGSGGDIVVIEGDASISDVSPTDEERLLYLEKYKPTMDSYGWTIDDFSKKYKVPVRISPTKFRYW